jgi:hypothetical protein
MITAGSVTEFFLFDVAHSIDLDGLQAALGAGASTAEWSIKNSGAPRIKYERAPIVADGAVFGCGEVAAFKVRIKLFDYGVISVMLTQPFAGSWSDLVALGQQLITSDGPEREATKVCHTVIARVRPALSRLRETFLSEDYIVFAATAFDQPQSADSLIEHHGIDIAQLLRGERSALSWQEVDEVLRHRLSYFADDLIVPAWNAAFMHDTEAGVLAAHEVVEFVNSQLLEFRYYDELLEGELNRTYADLQKPTWSDRFIGRRHTRATRRLHTLFIDVNDLTDHMENSVKAVGDDYAARLVNLVAARLGVADWKGNVREKLKTLDDIHRFAVEQTTSSRANLLELTVVLILIIDLVLLLTGFAGS